MLYTVLCAQSLILGIAERVCVCVCVCVYVRVHACMFGRVQLFSTPLAVARQAPLSMEFSRQEYWSRVPFYFSGDLRHPGIKLLFPASPAGGCLSLCHLGSPGIAY